MTWRTTSFVLAALCVALAWRGCGHGGGETRDERAAAADCREAAHSRAHTAGDSHGAYDPRDDVEPPPPSGLAVAGISVPSWVTWLAPHPGEDMLAYRDRMLPIAQAAIAPHRARVARSRDDFAALANLDARQRGELDAAARDAAAAIEERVLGAVMSGDFSPDTFKPMTGVSAARDVLDAIDRANKRFLATLRDDQRTALAQHPFDFADYLVFATRWEDLLGVTN
jgi:hypothetical protein